MQFDPRNHIVKLCINGMVLEESGKHDEAAKLFQQAWNESSNDFEKFLSAWFISRNEKANAGKLQWTEIALQLAIKLNDDSVKAAFPSLYTNLAKFYEESGDSANAKKNYELSTSFTDIPSDEGPFYHGTRADLQVGDLLVAGFQSNYQPGITMNHIYFTALINGAGLAAALANGNGRERVYVVEPTGDFENDPNVTNKKFPGNPTRSYRTHSSLKIIGEVKDWAKQTPEDIQKWKEKLANSKGEIIN